MNIFDTLDFRPPSLPPHLSKIFVENISGIAFSRGVQKCYLFLMKLYILKVIHENMNILIESKNSFTSNISQISWKTRANDRSQWVDIFWLIFLQKISIFCWKIHILKYRFKLEIHGFWGGGFSLSYIHDTMIEYDGEK